MPNIDEGAKEFELARAGWFGRAVSWRRKALNLTASELSRRTDELGYPISRGAIAKIESNLRSGKIDVAEVLVLSAALDIPPVLLLFPQFSTDGSGAVLPGVLAKEDEAVLWMSGQVPLPQGDNMPALSLEREDRIVRNDGVQLVVAMRTLEEALETRISLVHHLQTLKADGADVADANRMLEINNELIRNLRQQIREARESLWGVDAAFAETETKDDE
ncbi:XRE family transcriptional regulator [Mycolicibacterium sp. CH28]|uniref:helix-turn-helix domain-containing protein n=1 Tax=Mycolicibacterium sp. CH28 TaxID=2512237 RepID=UPI001081509E|nr:helix-turn-helix transcriptional regulator [Mycolicibacterium sp. CH28]TGD89221.1 XRE family transcriptional regulator [Mycolicibacterium sp. CH28]